MNSVGTALAVLPAVAMPADCEARPPGISMQKHVSEDRETGISRVAKSVGPMWQAGAVTICFATLEDADSHWDHEQCRDSGCVPTVVLVTASSVIHTVLSSTM